jgi:hypothetical protein
MAPCNSANHDVSKLRLPESRDLLQTASRRIQQWIVTNCSEEREELKDQFRALKAANKTSSPAPRYVLIRISERASFAPPRLLGARSDFSIVRGILQMFD